jgi:autotransporter translocation and assembly factor TamB
METHAREQTATTVQDDPKARATLRQAFEKTARWQPDFKGFAADLSINVNGKEAKGTVTVKGPRDVIVTLSDPELQKWAEGQIGMIAVHRGPRSFEESDGKHSLTLGDDTDHPLGPRLMIHGDGMHSFYRVK